MIKLDESTIKRSWATWHKDPQTNKEQAARLVADVKATQQKLAMEAIEARFGRKVITSGLYKTRMELRREGNARWWLVWHEDKAKQGRGTALAVFTMPVTRLDAFKLVCEWHWVTLPWSKSEKKRVPYLAICLVVSLLVVVTLFSLWLN
jgi:hypothetical protein